MLTVLPGHLQDDIALLKTYGLGPYSNKIKDVEKDLKDVSARVNDICGIKESDTGLAAPSSLRQAGYAGGAAVAGMVVKR